MKSGLRGTDVGHLSTLYPIGVVLCLLHPPFWKWLYEAKPIMYRTYSPFLSPTTAFGQIGPFLPHLIPLSVSCCHKNQNKLLLSRLCGFPVRNPWNLPCYSVPIGLHSAASTSLCHMAFSGTTMSSSVVQSFHTFMMFSLLGYSSTVLAILSIEY